MRSVFKKIVAWFARRLALAFPIRKPQVPLRPDTFVKSSVKVPETGGGNADSSSPKSPFTEHEPPKSDYAESCGPVSATARGEQPPNCLPQGQMGTASPKANLVEDATSATEASCPESPAEGGQGKENPILRSPAEGPSTNEEKRGGLTERPLAQPQPVPIEIEDAIIIPQGLAELSETKKLAGEKSHRNKRAVDSPCGESEQPAAANPPMVPENKEGAPPVHSIPGKEDSLKSAGVPGPADSELDWPGFSERPETVPRKPNGPRAARIAEDRAETPMEDSDDSDEQASPVSANEPPASIDFSEYSGPGAETLSNEYLYWNQVLLARFIRAAANGTMHAATSPRSLASALIDDLGVRVPPAEAEARFCDAVASTYRTQVVGSLAGLKAFRRRSLEGTPLCVAFLSLSVLAAHKMHTDELSSSNAYYSRLAQLLTVDLVNGFPVDFRSSEFESLWLFLADWISKNRGLSLALPQGTSQKRYIAYPLAHVPLRQLDLEKLPVFFDWAGYSPDIQPPPERIEDDFRKWDQSYARLSEAGRAAISDSRLPAVIAQIRSELKAWDGLVADPQGLRYAQVEILLETAERRLKLSLLAPRREGFPQVFTSGPVQMIGGESWYDPLELKPENGLLLLEGFLWPSEDEPRCILRRPSGRVFALGPNPEYSGQISRLELPKNTVCAVLCHESLSDVVASYLAEICESPPRPTKENSVPNGWVLFPRARAIRKATNVPPELRSLDVASEAMIIPQGGLRLGIQWTWMHGAAPRLLVEGHEGEPVTVNGAPVALDEDGFINDSGILSVAGLYIIKVGSLEKKVRIIQPSLRPSVTDAQAGYLSMMKCRHPAILDVGDWVIVGSRPGEAANASVSSRRSCLVFCDFEPVWAIKLGARKRQTRVVQLAGSAVYHGKLVGKKTSVRVWASSLCSAAIRRPTLEAAAGKNAEGIAKTWYEYVRAAREIMRSEKRPNR